MTSLLVSNITILFNDGFHHSYYITQSKAINIEDNRINDH